ncbi:MAG: hypothetical protein L0226_13830 [Acidobacteria bacterium]|nr:hypothetical protein [Acidobacteriota bacterium]
MLPDPPSLTEEWASAYLQILFGLFVFSIGIPALIAQLITQEEIRLFAQRMLRRWWWYLCIGLSSIASLLFVFLLHPAESTKEFPPWKSLLAVIVITGASFFVLGLSLLLRGYERETIIGRLKKNLLKSLNRKNRLDDQAVKDLVYLGEKGNPGHEKELVLRVIKDVVDAAQKSDRYSGDQLDRLLHELPTILANKEEPGNDGNFEMAAQILRQMRDEFPREQLHSTRDQITAIRMITLLGIEAVRLGLERAAFTFVQLVESGSHELAFEIGLSALRSRRFRLAVAALRKLETLAENQESLSNDEVTSHLLGLLAHFAVSSISTSQHAEKTLSALAPYCSPSLKECLNNAYRYHCENLRFDTADSIAVLLHAVEGEVDGLQRRLFPDKQISRNLLFQE